LFFRLCLWLGRDDLSFEGLDLWLDWKVHSFDLEDLLFERKVQRVEGLAQSEEQKVHSVFLQDLSVFLQDLWVFRKVRWV
jgi:hypothetical protein